jgi:hypothetical protein
MVDYRLRPLTHLQVHCHSDDHEGCTGVAVACDRYCGHLFVYADCPLTTVPGDVTCMNCKRTTAFRLAEKVANDVSETLGGREY